MQLIQVSPDNYSKFYSLTQTFVQGPMLLPTHWINCLWGILAYSDRGELLGGWIGRKRLSGWKAKLYQEIVFDSMPQLSNNVSENHATLQNKLIAYTLELGKQQGIAVFVVTHWSRTKLEYNYHNFLPEKNATFINDLKKDNLIMTVDSSLRNKIRKAEKLGVQFIVYDKCTAIEMLHKFQELRAETRARAIERNNDSSMLLKSESYYRDILENYDSTLVASRTQDGQVASMTLCIKSGKTMYTYYSGSDIEQNRKTGCSAYLKWKIFELAAQQGCSQVDMSGVPVNPTLNDSAYGVYKFKQSFGGEYKEYTSGVFVLNQFKYRLMSIIKKQRKLLRIISKTM